MPWVIRNPWAHDGTDVENGNAHHDHETCHPMNRLAKHKIDCVICGGMGRDMVAVRTLLHRDPGERLPTKHSLWDVVLLVS